MAALTVDTELSHMQVWMLTHVVHNRSSLLLSS